jgi:hypothetical protein
MIATNVDRISARQGVLAAMVYLATFLSLGYGLYAIAVGAAFLESVAIAYPFAFAASALLFVCCALVERFRAPTGARLDADWLTSSVDTRSVRYRQSG